MDSVKNSKLLSIIFIALIYVMASCLGVWVYFLIPFPFWLKLLLADAAATVFVFVFSLVPLGKVD